MSIRDVMMTQDIVDNSALPAGAGDFSRTAFEYSSEIAIQPTEGDDSGEFIPLVLGKFIALKTGLHKYVFDYTLTTEISEYLRYGVRLTNYMFPYATLQPNPSQDVMRDDANAYVARFIREELGRETWANAEKKYPMWRNLTLKGTTVSSNTVIYFPAMEGQAFVIYALRKTASAAINKKCFTIRNQKITY